MGKWKFRPSLPISEQSRYLEHLLSQQNHAAFDPAVTSVEVFREKTLAVNSGNLLQAISKASTFSLEVQINKICRIQFFHFPYQPLSPRVFIKPKFLLTSWFPNLFSIFTEKSLLSRSTIAVGLWSESGISWAIRLGTPLIANRVFRKSTSTRPCWSEQISIVGELSRVFWASRRFFLWRGIVTPTRSCFLCCLSFCRRSFTTIAAISFVAFLTRWQKSWKIGHTDWGQVIEAVQSDFSTPNCVRVAVRK